ncbi:MAG: Rieske (2Fe-2S) protein [Reichenbachiella sp.]|uniref:Rieske (2Fe-2S) protein n=1 Tax=Reichenbachiella sp. TaxID=2184521 RepID=UPI003296FC9C
MDRKTFIKKCSMGCFGVLASGLLLEGCVGTRYITGTIEGSFLNVPEKSFLKEDGERLKYIVVQHENLQYPIVLYRHSANHFQALLMRCTHQGTELQVYGDRLQCTAHGSEFTSSGEVQNGPADQSLRSFPVIKELEILKIDLS